MSNTGTRCRGKYPFRFNLRFFWWKIIFTFPLKLLKRIWKWHFFTITKYLDIPLVTSHRDFSTESTFSTNIVLFLNKSYITDRTRVTFLHPWRSKIFQNWQKLSRINCVMHALKNKMLALRYMPILLGTVINIVLYGMEHTFMCHPHNTSHFSRTKWFQVQHNIIYLRIVTPFGWRWMNIMCAYLPPTVCHIQRTKKSHTFTSAMHLYTCMLK